MRFAPSLAISADVRERLLDELVGDAVGETADKARDDFDMFRTDLTQIRLTKRGIARR